MKQKISCKIAENLIQKEIDGLISAEEQNKINVHLGTCFSCVKVKKELTQLHWLFKNNLSDIAVPSLSSNFDSTFFKRLNERTQTGFLDRIKQTLSIPLTILVEPKYAIGTIAIIMVAVIGMKGYWSISQEKAVINSTVLYDVAMKKSTDRELTNTANQQAKEILALAGLGGY
ncbi:MAG: hypothetical protein A3J83_03655 [Elusimicrobia bacterium RIFOXYA2_FULL_40_6]|nr:MAG: hypothetical protein A3J83_03655 [Elusimicrobia bacterium RIFOXYA2_FULL_40_6]